VRIGCVPILFVIRLKALAKHFGSIRAVDGLDLEIAQGEFYACLGPNAAGKTTTIKMISGLLRPTSGSVIVGGFDMLREPEKAKSQLAYVPDFPSFTTS
jgi:ABC-2 type transport system ATP-binding protein